MNQAISKTITISAIAATFMLGAVAARAEVYTGDTGHYLQAPQGYQQTTTTTTTTRPTFNGQGMGTGQLKSSYNQPAQPLTVTTTAASSRMLPQDSTPSVMPMQPSPVAMPMAPMAPAASMAMQPARIQTASVPSTQVSTLPSAQALAAMEPAAGSAFDSSTNVQIVSPCGTPGNHRQHKGINTSTTVGNDCFN